MCVSQCSDSDSVHTSSNKAYKIVRLIQSEKEGEEGASYQPLPITELPEEMYIPAIYMYMFFFCDTKNVCS